MSYSVDFINLFINFLLTIFAYCFVPVLLKLTLFKKRVYSSKQIRLIATINSVAIWLIFEILHFALETGESATVTAPVIYWFVNCWLLGRKKREKSVPFSNKMPVSNDADVSVEEYPNNIDVNEGDVCKDADSFSQKEEIRVYTNNYCSKCGNSISDDMSFCPHCGSKIDFENSFKELSKNESVKANKKSKKRVVIVCIAIIAVIVIGGLVLHPNFDNWKLQRIETKLTTTTAVEDGDIEVLQNLRDKYISHGGNVDTFDSLIQKDIEREFINAIDAEDTDKYIDYSNYLSQTGYTSDMISELICCTNLADTFQNAVRTNNYDVAVDCLSTFYAAGMTEEYGELLFNDALR